MADGSPKPALHSRAYRLRFYPTKTQQQTLAQGFGCARVIWNWALRWCSEAYRDTDLHHINGRGLSWSGVDVSRMLTQLKKDPEFAWLAACDSGVLSQRLRDFDTAYKNFFAGRAQYPRPKQRENAQSIRYAFDQRHASKTKAWHEGYLVLPGLGQLDVIWSRRPMAMPKLVTVSRDAAGRYWVSMAVEEMIEPLPAATVHAIGVDAGVKDLLVMSDGSRVACPRQLRKEQRHLRHLGRALSRKKKGSKRWSAHRRRMARLQVKIADRRRDAQHQASARLVRTAQVLCVEDLNVKGMVQNRHLALSVSHAGLGEVKRQILYKASWHGREVIQVGRWFASSKRCSVCHTQKSDLKLSERRWACPACGTQHDRDLNASRNILAEGLRIRAGNGVPAGGGDLMRVEGDTPGSPAATPWPTASVETRTRQPDRSPPPKASTSGLAMARISDRAG
jgi:putative transposase